MKEGKEGLTSDEYGQERESEMFMVNTLRGSTSRRRFVSFLTTPRSFRRSIPVRCCLRRGGDSNTLRGRQAGEGLTTKYGNPGNGLGAVLSMLDRFQVGIGNEVKCLQHSLLGLDHCLNENYLGEGHARENGEGPSGRRSSRFI